MAKLFNNRSPRTASIASKKSEFTELELAAQASLRLTGTTRSVEQVENTGELINNGAVALATWVATSKHAANSLANNGDGFSQQTIESINLTSRAISSMLGSSKPLFKLNKDDFSSKDKSRANTKKVAERTVESLDEAINAVMSATAEAVQSVTKEVADFMTTALKTHEAQVSMANDLLARVNELKTQALVKSDVVSDDPNLIYVTEAAKHNDAVGILNTRSAVLASIIDNIQHLPEHTIENVFADNGENHFDTVMKVVYTPLMESFDKVSQDTIPFVESGLDPAEWTPYMSKSFGIDGNAGMLCVSIPFISLAMGDLSYAEDMNFEGTWFMEADVTGGSTTDQPVPETATVLDIVEVEQFLTALPLTILETSDNLVASAEAMTIYTSELEQILANHDDLVMTNPNVALALGMIVDYSEYISRLAVPAIGQAIGDTDRVLAACAISLDAIRTVPVEEPAAEQKAVKTPAAKK